jgi:hypothetical protein
MKNLSFSISNLLSDDEYIKNRQLSNEWLISCISKLYQSDQNELNNQQDLSTNCKKSRCSFNKNQIIELEKIFHEKKYLSSMERMKISKKINLSDRQVKTWFQNRRTKWR